VGTYLILTPKEARITWINQRAHAFARAGDARSDPGPWRPAAALPRRGRPKGRSTY